MEYFKGILINDIIQEFKQISVSVKPDKQVNAEALGGDLCIA
jgi:hypothetical protein